jgi:hypothetical protein
MTNDCVVIVYFFLKTNMQFHKKDKKCENALIMTGYKDIMCM